jgi:hypothetical protein
MPSVKFVERSAHEWVDHDGSGRQSGDRRDDRPADGLGFGAAVDVCQNHAERGYLHAPTSAPPLHCDVEMARQFGDLKYFGAESATHAVAEQVELVLRAGHMAEGLPQTMRREGIAAVLVMCDSCCGTADVRGDLLAVLAEQCREQLGLLSVRCRHRQARAGGPVRDVGCCGSVHCTTMTVLGSRGIKGGRTVALRLAAIPNRFRCVPDRRIVEPWRRFH